MSEPGSDQNDGPIALLQQKLFDHYHTLAYFLIIGTYIISFTEYLYLRLVSLIFPERITHRRECEKHLNETIVRMEINYASTTLVFIVIGSFQVACFFLLTISGRWLTVRRTFKHFVSLEEKLRNELVFSIKRVMYVTVFPTFLVYVMCSAVLICSIFYMVGIRDPIESTGSRVIIYAFDASVIFYFLAFPIVCIIYHPRMKCRFKFCIAAVGSPRSKPSTPKATAHLIAYRRSNDIIDPKNLQVCIENYLTENVMHYLCITLLLIALGGGIFADNDEDITAFAENPMEKRIPHPSWRSNYRVQHFQHGAMPPIASQQLFGFNSVPRFGRYARRPFSLDFY